MALHIQFANTALRLGGRYRRLNNVLVKAFPIGKVVYLNTYVKRMIMMYTTIQSKLP